MKHVVGAALAATFSAMMLSGCALMSAAMEMPSRNPDPGPPPAAQIQPQPAQQAAENALPTGMPRPLQPQRTASADTPVCSREDFELARFARENGYQFQSTCR